MRCWWLSLAILAVCAAPAQAASNACNFSVDEYWTSIDASFDGAATPAGNVLPGDTVKLSGAHASAVLPAYMAMLGYNAGILKAGQNDIPVKVWLAVEATNTLEGVRRVGPISVQATTTITTNPDGSFASATPITYTPPVLDDMQWTAVGGDVLLRQAPAGAITDRLPIGPNNALRPIKGSLVILADLSPIRFSMDCQPGRGNEFGTGPVPETGPAFDTHLGPLNETCTNGTHAGIRFTGPTFEYAAGSPVKLSGVTLQTTLTAPATVTVPIRATGTAEGVQSVTFALGSAVPDTTWTPTGDGPIAFSQGGRIGVSTVSETFECVAGTLTIDHPSPPVFARATVPPPPPPPDPTPTPIATTPVATATPTPPVNKPAAVGKVSVKSSKLTLKRGKAKLVLACSKAGPCKGKYVIGGRSRSYSIAAGKSKTYTLTVSRKTKRVKVTLRPASGKSVNKTLTVRRT